MMYVLNDGKDMKSFEGKQFKLIEKFKEITVEGKGKLVLYKECINKLDKLDVFGGDDSGTRNK